MENSYGIGVRNRYALFLDDESDPLELLKEKEQEKEQKKKTKVAEKENKAKVDTVTKPKPVTPPKKVVKEPPLQKGQDIKREDSKPTSQKPHVEGKPERSVNKFANENREERNNRRNREDKQANGPTEGFRTDREERPRRDNLGNHFENRNRGIRSAGNREGGMRNTGSRGRNFDNRRGKREFDRQSGSDKTGVKSIEKREGGGAHNWGSHKDVIEEADKTNEADASWGETEKNDTGLSPAETKEKVTEHEPEQPTPEVEELKVLTLDEWKAQRAGRMKPQYNIRKAGEGEDPTQWKKMYELKKKEQVEFESEEEEYDASEYPQRVGRQKHILDIDIHFNDTRRSGGGGGGGGSGGGGGRGRGPRSRGPRSNRDRQRFRGNQEPVMRQTVAVDDTVLVNDVRLERARLDKSRLEKTPKVDDERDFPSLG